MPQDHLKVLVSVLVTTAKICGRADSYFQSVAMLLGGDWVFFDNNKGLHSELAMIFAFVIGILLLNVIIAVVSNVYTDIESNSQKAIWASRLRFVNELGSMRSAFPFLNICSFKEASSSSHYLPERRILSQWDPRGHDDWDSIGKEDDDWVPVHHTLRKEDDDWEDNNQHTVKRNGRADFIKWYVCVYRIVGYDNKRVGYDDFGLWWRLRGFMHIAEWKEILLPSRGFQKV